MKQQIRAALFGIALALAVTPFAAAKEATPLSAVKIDTLAVKIDNKNGDFTVIDARMDETGTAGVLFGIIGMTVNSAANNSEDAKEADPLRPAAAALDVPALVGDALRARLASRPDAIKLADAPGASNTLLVEIGEWGLIRKAQKPETDMRAFLKVNISILDAKGQPVWGPTREHSVGQLTGDISIFTPDVFKAEIEKLATNAGKQIGSELIYR